MTIKEPLENSLHKRYGKLIVLSFTGDKNKHGEKFVHCICDCGNEKICLLRLIRRGSVISCGCAKKVTSSKNIKKAHQNFIDNETWKDPLLRTQQSVYKKYSDCDISFDEFLILSQQNCFYCGGSPSNYCSAYYGPDITEERKRNSYFRYNGLDRIDNLIGHTKDNVVSCCTHCNTAKLDRTQKDFLEWVNLIYCKHNT